jgi:hypothetical protein
MTALLLPPGQDLWTYTGATAVAYLLSVSLNAVALRVAWRLVGGKAPVSSFFVTYAYFFGAAVVLLVTVLLLSAGVFKVVEPDLYAQVAKAQLNKQPMPDLSGSSVILISLFISAVGFLCVAVWGFIACGTYRQLNGLSKWRSFIAMMIMGLLSWPVAAVVFFVHSAMMGK